MLVTALFSPSFAKPTTANSENVALNVLLLGMIVFVLFFELFFSCINRSAKHRLHSRKTTSAIVKYVSIHLYHHRRNVVAYLIAIIVLSILFAYGALSRYMPNEYVRTLLIYLSVYLALYVLVGVVYSLFCYYIANTYRGMEEKCQNKHGNLKAMMADCDSNYVLLRNAFVNPTHLPTISESNLRPDFNFAEYMTCALDKTVSNVVNTSAVTYLVLICVIMVWLSSMPGSTPTYKVSSRTRILAGGAVHRGRRVHPGGTSGAVLAPGDTAESHHKSQRRHRPVRGGRHCRRQQHDPSSRPRRGPHRA
ncbi:MAG: hypothetical protein P4M11_02800 [Candidatus Pacebacteria bacterium]|nr:hypothetical protein [Candidatus Paceibacterota bacterium]